MIRRMHEPSPQKRGECRLKSKFGGANGDAAVWMWAEKDGGRDGRMGVSRRLRMLG